MQAITNKVVMIFLEINHLLGNQIEYNIQGLGKARVDYGGRSSIPLLGLDQYLLMKSVPSQG